MFWLLRKNIFIARRLQAYGVTQSSCCSSVHESSGNQSGTAKPDVVVSSPFPSIKYPDCLIYEHVWSNINKWSHKVALVNIFFLPASMLAADFKVDKLLFILNISLISRSMD